MALANACYFLVCLTLNQCNTYEQHVQQFLPGVKFDKFFWLNPAGLPVNTPQEHSLSALMASESSLQHWGFTNPSAMHWLPYYYYSKQTDNTCKHYVKLDTDLLFAQPSFDYAQILSNVGEQMTSSDAALASFEAACQAEPSIESGTILSNLPVYMALLAEFQRVTAAANTRLYVTGAFDEFLATPSNRRLLPTLALDMTDCIETSTTVSLAAEEPATTDAYPFLRLAPKFDAIKVAMEEEKPAGAAGNSVHVF